MDAGIYDEWLAALEEPIPYFHNRYPIKVPCGDCGDIIEREREKRGQRAICRLCRAKKVQGYSRERFRRLGNPQTIHS